MASSTSLSVFCAGRNGVRRNEATSRETKASNLEFIASAKKCRWSELVSSRPLKCGSAELKLFDVITTRAQKSKHAAGSTHMGRARDNEVRLPAVQISL